jgi:hypothetical protein
MQQESLNSDSHQSTNINKTNTYFSLQNGVGNPDAGLRQAHILWWG